ncbi:hypothetical protein QQF64_023381 [Cirrhinus molitorella]|uniref:Uncharacterized protein n=1 Tax=Cirrhinus molitorella TaxID=172907 RepID=A0ABR3L6K5_9TELE
MNTKVRTAPVIVKNRRTEVEIDNEEEYEENVRESKAISRYGKSASGESWASERVTPPDAVAHFHRYGVMRQHSPPNVIHRQQQYHQKLTTEANPSPTELCDKRSCDA